MAEGAEETRLFDTQGRLLEEPKVKETSVSEKSSSYSGSSSYRANSVQTQDISETKTPSESFTYSGWRMLPNGTYIRVFESRESSGRSSSSSSGSADVSQASGFQRGSGGLDSQEVRLSGNNGFESTAAGNNYDARESSGSGSFGQSYESSSSFSSSSSRGGAADSASFGWTKLPDGTWSRQSSSSTQYIAGGSTAGGRGGASSIGVSSSMDRNGATSTSLGETGSLDVLMNAARGPGDYHGTMSKAELEREAGGRVFSAGAGTETRNQVTNTQYRGAGSSSIGSSGTSSSGSSSSGSSSRGSSGSSGYSSSSSRGSYNEVETEDSNAGSRYTGEGEDYVTTARGRWVWSEESKKWVWEEGSAASSGQQQSVDQSSTDSGSTDSGWTILPNGTYVRKMSSWSSSSSGSSGAGGSAGAGFSSGSSGSAGYRGSSSRGRQGYFESGTLGGSSGDGQSSGNSDSGWVLLANGTYVRKQSSWSASSDSSLSSGVGAGSVLPSEFGDEGNNSTGWIRQPDGTMVKKSSSWASWSSSSVGELGDDQLRSIQNQLETRARNSLNTLPGNVEPGFEKQYLRTHRSVFGI